MDERTSPTRSIQLVGHIILYWYMLAKHLWDIIIIAVDTKCHAAWKDTKWIGHFYANKIGSRESEM